MTVSDADIAHATDLFAGLGEITSRRMMGGLCLYCDGTLFAILHPEGGIMLKARGDFVFEIEARGGAQWRYRRAGQKETRMPYWSLPDSAQDDPAEAISLARRALEFL